MTYRALADLLVVVHLAFIVFVVAGGWLVVRWPWLAALHLPAAVWGVWIELSGGVCPLTPWEQALRVRAGEAGYEGGFVEHYVVEVIYPPGLTPTVQALLGISVVAVNVAAYAWVWHRRRGGRDDFQERRSQRSGR